jgi:hypothetical protein
MFNVLLTLLGIFPLFETPGTVNNPALVFADSGYFLAWEESVEDSIVIFATFLDRSYNPLGKVRASPPSLHSYTPHAEIMSDRFCVGYNFEVYDEYMDAYVSCSALTTLTLKYGQIRFLNRKTLACGHSDYYSWSSVLPPAVGSLGAITMAAVEKCGVAGGFESCTILCIFLDTSLTVINSRDFYVDYFGHSSWYVCTCPQVVYSYNDIFHMVYAQYDSLFAISLNEDTIVSQPHFLFMHEACRHGVSDVQILNDRSLYVEEVDSNIHAVLFNAMDHSVIDTFFISDAQYPTLSVLGDKFYLFYRSNDHKIYGAKITYDGQLINNKAIIEDTREKKALNVATDGEGFFLVFVMEGDLYGAYIDTSLAEAVVEGPYVEGYVLDLAVLPNLVKRELRLRVSLRRPQLLEFSLVNMAGRVIPLGRKFVSGDQILNFLIPEGFPSGSYILLVRTDKGIVKRRLIHIK